MKKKDILNKREEELMNYLWEIKKPLTASEMAKQLESDGWTNITLCRTVQSLSDNGYLEVAGLEKTTKNICEEAGAIAHKGRILFVCSEKQGNQ